MANKGSGRTLRLLTVIAMFMAEGGDNEFCGVGENTVLWGYDLGCDVDWQQIFLFSAMAWIAGTAIFFPIIVIRAFRGRS